MIGVNPVIVRDIETVLHRHMVHQHIFTAQHMQAPKWRIAKGEVAHHEIGATGEHEHLGPPILEEPPLVRRVVARHKGQRLTKDFAGAGDFQVRGIGCQQHSIAGINTLVRADEQRAREMKIYSTPEL